MRRMLIISVVVAATACSSNSATPTGSNPPTPKPAESSSSTSTTLAATSTTLAPIEVTFAFTGDTLIHSPLWATAATNGEATDRPYDFRPMFADVRGPISGADYAICHLETLFAPPGVKLGTMPKYQVPTEVADALADAGYDRCSTASNHTMDGGVASIDHTVAALEAVGISQAGMARTPAEIEPTVVEIKGLRFAHLSYTIHFNGMSLPAEEPWRSARVDIDRILEDAATARRLGARIVIVSMHWGNEGSSRPNPDQKEWSARLAESGLVDIVVGSHPHVLQPIEKIGNMWVLNSLGNFISAMPTGDKWPASTQDGAIVLVTVVENSSQGFDITKPVVLPTWVDRDAGYVVRDAKAWMATHPDDERVAESLERSLAVLGDYVVAP